MSATFIPSAGYEAVYEYEGHDGARPTRSLPIAAIAVTADGRTSAAVLNGIGKLVAVDEAVVGGRFLGVRPTPTPLGCMCS